LALGPKVRVEAAHLSPAADDSALAKIIDGSGLNDRAKDALPEHDTSRASMWLGTWTTNVCLEFDLADAVPLEAVEVWNFNGAWQTTNGVRRADVAVSADGTTWQTILRGAEIAEADGTPDYDEPSVLKLGGVMARKVRFENIVPRNESGWIGLSEVVFHRTGSATESTGAQSGK
jgi:hypothetical protein